MSLETNMSLCLSFQPNSVAAQGRTGFIAGGFSMSAPTSSLGMFLACAGFNGGMGGIYQPAGVKHTGEVQGITPTQLTGQPQRQHNDVQGWNTDERFINRIDKGRHYSRPDGLPLSPPPKRRQRRGKWRGEAES